jgi:hypothetical protein
MSKSVKFLAIALGGLAGMVILGMVVAYFAGIDEGSINELDLARDWAIYRIAFYIAAVALWPQISIFLTRPRFDMDALSDEEFKTYTEKRDMDVEYLKKQWWKVVAMFVFFEGVMIQQLGL